MLPDIDTLERLARARDFIDHCYDHPLSLEQISEKACFSRYHFLRLFRQAFNKTPHQYLIERRIEKAKELGVKAELVRRAGKEHGWPGIEQDIEVLAKWFDDHLSPGK